jgi:hypothetical protein
MAALKPFDLFDLREFEADPESYLGTVEPGRCFQTAQAKGPDDVRLKLTSSAFVTISRGETAVQKVKGAPRAPVTFTSFNGGVFEESKLGSVTVRADAEGLAEARFSVGAGIAGNLRIQVGSPLAVGTSWFVSLSRGAHFRPTFGTIGVRPSMQAGGFGSEFDRRRQRAQGPPAPAERLPPGPLT